MNNWMLVSPGCQVRLRSEGPRMMLAGEAWPPLSQSYRQRWRRSPFVWFTVTGLQDCYTTRRLRGRWEQSSGVSWQRQAERWAEKLRETERGRGGVTESGGLPPWMLEVGFQSAEWHFLSLCWRKRSMSAALLSHPILHAEQLRLAHTPPTIIILLQFSPIMQQTCDSSLRVIDLSSFGLQESHCS